MDREHIKGAADKAKGAIKDSAGKVTADTGLQAEGKLSEGRGTRRRRRRKRRVPQSDQIAQSFLRSANRSEARSSPGNDVLNGSAIKCRTPSCSVDAALYTTR